MFTYILNGYVHPTRVMCNLDRKGFKIDHTGFNISGTGVFGVSNSNLYIEYISCIEVTKFYDLKNILEDFVVHPAVDAYCFIKSYGYDIEIDSIYDMQKKSFNHFAVQVEPDVSTPERELSESSMIDDILFSNSSGTNITLGLVLADFRRALREAADTAFYCYRLIETIRINSFEDKKIEDDGKREKEAWKQMSAKLKCRKEEYDDLRQKSIATRHGHNPLITGGERIQELQLVRRIILEFISYIKDNSVR